MSEEALAWLLCGPASVAGLWVGIGLAYSETLVRNIRRAADSVRRAVNKLRGKQAG